MWTRVCSHMPSFQWAQAVSSVKIKSEASNTLCCVQLAIHLHTCAHSVTVHYCQREEARPGAWHTWEAEAGGSLWVPGQFDLHRQFYRFSLCSSNLELYTECLSPKKGHSLQLLLLQRNQKLRILCPNKTDTSFSLKKQKSKNKKLGSTWGFQMSHE